MKLHINTTTACLFGMFALNERVGEEQAGRRGHTNGDGVSNVHQRAEEGLANEPTVKNPAM